MLETPFTREVCSINTSPFVTKVGMTRTLTWSVGKYLVNNQMFTFSPGN